MLRRQRRQQGLLRCHVCRRLLLQRRLLLRRSQRVLLLPRLLPRRETSHLARHNLRVLRLQTLRNIRVRPRTGSRSSSCCASSPCYSSPSACS